MGGAAFNKKELIRGETSIGRRSTFWNDPEENELHMHKAFDFVHGFLFSFSNKNVHKTVK